MDKNKIIFKETELLNSARKLFVSAYEIQYSLENIYSLSQKTIDELRKREISCQRNFDIMNELIENEIHIKGKEDKK